MFACTILPAAAGNPVLRGADPHAAVLDRQVWIYPTGRGEQLFVWSSRDLQRWEKSGPILEIEAIDWIKADGAPVHQLWAPCVARRNNKVYLYYSVGPQNPTPCLAQNFAIACLFAGIDSRQCVILRDTAL